jgi:hypothetical protein
MFRIDKEERRKKGWPLVEEKGKENKMNKGSVGISTKFLFDSVLSAWVFFFLFFMIG